MAVAEWRPSLRERVSAKILETLILNTPPLPYPTSPRPGFIGSPSLEEKTTRLAEMRPCTSGTSAAQILDFYNLPHLPKRSLDVCAGGSPLTAELLKKGVDALALDLNFGNRLPFLRRNLSGVAELILKDPHVVSREVDSPQFWQSIQDNPDRYIQGDATKLPFPDNSFDLVLSFYGYCGVLDIDMQTLTVAVDEALRVLEPGGELRFGPFLTKNGRTVTDFEILNQYCLLRALGSRKDLEVRARDDYSGGWSTNSYRYFSTFGMLTVRKKG